MPNLNNLPIAHLPDTQLRYAVIEANDYGDPVIQYETQVRSKAILAAINSFNARRDRFRYVYDRQHHERIATFGKELQ